MLMNYLLFFSFCVLLHRNSAYRVLVSDAKIIKSEVISNKIKQNV